MKPVNETTRRVVVKSLINRTGLLAILFAVSACSEQTGQGLSSAVSDLNLQKQSLVKFNLTDAPNEALKSVVVDIDHLEVLVAGASKAGRLILAKGLGPVDLLKLQNGVILPLQEVVAPEGLKIQQIRLILKQDGHYAIKADDSVCALQTPSAQRTGVKIILTNKISFDAGHEYNVLVDFDALKSVVIKGNGDCLLKPVLKLKSVTKAVIVEQPDDLDESGGSDQESGEQNGEEELVTDPDENDQEGDGWDYTPIVDGQDYPTVEPDELETLN